MTFEELQEKCPSKKVGYKCGNPHTLKCKLYSDEWHGTVCCEESCPTWHMYQIQKKTDRGEH